MKLTSLTTRDGRRSQRRSQRHRLSMEPLEPRRMMFATYVGQGDPNGVWGTTNLSYSYSNFLDFAPGWADGLSRVDMQNAVEEAMGVWTAVTPLRFFAQVDSGPAPSETPYAAGSNPTIRWGHHAIPSPNPPLVVLAHALRPGTGGLNGDPHYNDTIGWTINQILETGAHEFGHAIGLAHANGDTVGSTCPSPIPAIMDACAGSFSYNGLESAFLLPDDINGIHSLYGAGLGYVIDGFGELNVYGGAGNDLLSVDFVGGNIIVSSSIVGGPFVGSFSRPINDGQTVINSIQLHGLGGNDVLRVVNSNGLRVNAYGGAGGDIFDVGFASNSLNGIGETQFFAGTGNDSLFAYDGNNNSGSTYSVTSTRFDRPGWAGTRFFDDLENRSLTTGNTANTVNVFNTSTNRPTTINNGGGLDIVNLGTNNSLQQIQGNVTIQNDPSFTTLNLNNSADPVARTVLISQQSGNLGQLSGLAPGAILWDNTDIAAINVTTGTGADAINVLGISEVMKITNAGGRDTVVVGSSINGMQGITGNLTIQAFFGLGQPLILNDANSNIARAATMTAVGIDYTIAGLSTGSVTYRDFSEVTVFQGGGSDTFTFNTNVFHRLDVFGGGGNDGFLWGAVNNYSEGLGGTFVSAVNLDGGTGFNSLSVNDTARTLATTYQLNATRFYSRDPSAFGTGADFLYDNMNAIGITANNLANQITVFGVSSDIDPGNQVTININGGNDNVYVYPHDTQGNLTINGNLGIVGGSGTDSLYVDDAASPVPATYSFANPFGPGTQNIYGLGAAGFGVGSDFEAITMIGSAGNDVYNIDSYKSGMGLIINAGLGDDVCNFGNNDVATNVTNIASFLFNGQEGSDTFNLRNANPDNSFTYTAAANTTLQASRTFPTPYSISLEYYNTERKVIYAGPAVDILNVTSFASGQLDFHGAGGDDALNLPTSSDLLGRRVNFYGDEGTANRINHIVNSKTTPSTVHVTQNTIGAFPGDNFFAPGGSVFFESVQLVNVRMGSGADTAYVQPDATAAITIVGGNPTTAPGDTLNLTLANAQNYSVNGTVATGNVTSTNLQTLNWSGFESGPNIDDTSPQVLAAGFDGGAPAQEDFPTVSYQFSEDVSSTLDVNSLVLINTTTNVTVPNGFMNLAYDTGANIASFTFPGYFEGRLPVGDYSATLATSVSDFFGNQLGAEPPLLFSVMAVTSTFTVNSTADPGDGICDVAECTLREAIDSANASPNLDANTPDNIVFEFPGPGPYTIQPLSQLPDITEPVILDGTTQLGFAGTPIIELDGSLAGDANGLVILSGNSTVRGFVINRFQALPTAGSGIYLSGPGGNVIQGNYVGTNLAGDDVFASEKLAFGVAIVASDGNVIGTDGDGVNDVTEGNVLSGATGAGLLLQFNAADNIVAGNYIGISADGSLPLGNDAYGVQVSSTGNRIGTNSDGLSDEAERNVISANSDTGIVLVSDGNLVTGNFIGTDATGTLPLGNGKGVWVVDGSYNTVGGAASGAGNLIAFNTQNGVLINGGSGNSILGNSLFDNVGLGIDLSNASFQGDGVTLNDLGDDDVGSNDLQNFPELTSAGVSSGVTTLGGTLNTAANTTYLLQFFVNDACDPSGYGQGQSLLGTTQVVTDANGDADFSVTFPIGVSAGQFITATATDPLGSTSEFSACFAVDNGITGDFNHDGLLDGLDIDALVEDIASNTNGSEFDLTGDSLVDLADRDAWLAIAGAFNLPSGNPYLLGDATLDGVVDGQDFIAWNTNKFTNLAAWTRGDFTADGVVDGQDFIQWNTHKFQSSDRARLLAVTPPPGRSTSAQPKRAIAVERPAQFTPLTHIAVQSIDSAFASWHQGERLSGRTKGGSSNTVRHDIPWTSQGHSAICPACPADRSS